MCKTCYLWTQLWRNRDLYLLSQVNYIVSTESCLRKGTRPCILRSKAESMCNPVPVQTRNLYFIRQILHCLQTLTGRPCTSVMTWLFIFPHDSVTSRMNACLHTTQVRKKYHPSSHPFSNNFSTPASVAWWEMPPSLVVGSSLVDSLRFPQIAPEHCSNS